MTGTIQAIETELSRLKEEQKISIGKKVLPEVAERLAKCLPIAADESASVIHREVQPAPTTKPIEGSNQFSLAVFHRLKEKFGGVPTWTISDEQFLRIVKEMEGK